MLLPLRQQVFYSVCALLVLAFFPWLIFTIYGPAAIGNLGEIRYFEAGQAATFPVKRIGATAQNLIRFGFPALAGVWAVLCLAFFRPEVQKLPAAFRRLLLRSRLALNQELNAMGRREKILAGITFLLVLAERSYYALQYPIHTDEAASFLLFIRNGPLAIAGFYPIPNNHLLQNLLAWPLTFFFTDPFWVLRLPPLLFSLLLTFSGFLILKRFSHFLVAYLATALFSFGSLTLFLATQGRGYTLLTLLAVWAMALLFKALQTRKGSYWALFSLVSSLGFFTVPVFAYPFAACLAFAGLFLVFRLRFTALLQVAFAALIALAGAALLYLPLFLISGPEALLANKYLAALTPEAFSQQFPVFFREVQGELVGGKFGNGILAFQAGVILLALTFTLQKHSVFRKYLVNKTTWLAGFCLLLTAVIYGMLRYQLVLPPPRVLFFKSFFDYTILALVLAVALQLLFQNQKLRQWLAFGGVLVFAGFQLQATEFFLKDYPQPYYTSPALNKLIKESGARQVYVAEPFYQLFLAYEYARSGQEIRIENQVPAGGGAFDFVVLEHTKELPPGLNLTAYEKIYDDVLVKAYRRKSLP